MMYAIGIPMAEPSSTAARIHSQLKTWCESSVPVTASSIPNSPANTPRRAVAGEFIHFSERMNNAPATI
jgi:hypothetical protein